MHCGCSNAHYIVHNYILKSIVSPFKEREIIDALNHADLATGPDGWTSSQIAKLKGLAVFCQKACSTCATAPILKKSGSRTKLLHFIKAEYVQNRISTEKLSSYRPL